MNIAPHITRPGAGALQSVSSVDDPKTFCRTAFREAFDGALGNREEAVSRLKAALATHLHIEGALATHLFHEFCASAIRLMAHEQNRRLVTELHETDEPGETDRAEAPAAKPWQIPAGEGSGLAARRRNDVTIFAWQLPGGKPLGDATAADLQTSIAYWKSRIATDKGHLALAARLLPRLQERPITVRDAFSAADLEAAFRAAGVGRDAAAPAKQGASR